MDSFGKITNRLIGVKPQGFYPSFKQGNMTNAAISYNDKTGISVSYLFNQKGTMIVKALGNKPVNMTCVSMTKNNWVDNQWGGGVTFASGDYLIDNIGYGHFLFGDSLNDMPMSIIALVQTGTSVAVNDVIMSKFATVGTSNEWLFSLFNVGKLVLYLQDKSSIKVTYNLTDNALSTNTKYWLGVTYDGRGGATAASGMKIYINGLQVASTATNDAGYVAMELTTTKAMIGNITTATALPWTGSITMVSLYGRELSAQEMLNNYNDPFFMFRGVPMFPTSGAAYRRRTLVGG